MNPSCAAHHAIECRKEDPIPTSAVSLTTIDVPEYFVGAIPAQLKSVYEVLGIKFVCVKSANVEYFILASSLPSVVRRLNLSA